MKIVIATIKSWNIKLAEEFKQSFEGVHEVRIVSGKEQLDGEEMRRFAPDYIFFPHWSHIIPPEIYENYECIVFHMTDLPYGRGGSPLQNLIVRGHKDTVISALKVEKELDAGPVYMKYPLSLDGRADEIYKRASETIFHEMIPRIVEEEPEPKTQEGDAVIFKRRTADESRLTSKMNMTEIYDHIRMLDAEGYPNAFISFGGWKLIFTDAEMADGKLSAKVCFVRNGNG